MYCTVCGEKNEDNALFCVRCNKSFTEKLDPLPIIPSTYYQQAYQPMGGMYYDDRQKGKATVSLVLGLVAIIGWIIPLLGFPITIVGLIMGVKGLKSSKHGVAQAGIILNIIFLVLTIINSVLGVVLAISK